MSFSRSAARGTPGPPQNIFTQPAHGGLQRQGLLWKMSATGGQIDQDALGLLRKILRENNRRHARNDSPFFESSQLASELGWATLLAFRALRSGSDLELAAEIELPAFADLCRPRLDAAVSDRSQVVNL